MNPEPTTTKVSQHHSDSEEEVVNKEEEEERPSQFDIWTLITSQNDKQDKSTLPHVHPLGKRSSSSLSEKSLEICTESLGSETGSDGFSFESEDDSEIDHSPQSPQQKIQIIEDVENDVVQIVKQKQTEESCFPPPISSLSSGDGASIRMETRRDNGRLVMEAVKVPTSNNFRAQRHDGRLVLTFIPTEYDSDNNFEEEEEEDNEEILQEEEKTKSLIGFHRLTLMTNKKHYLGSANNNFNKEVVPKSKSLPPPRMIPKSPASAVSFNAYEYYWRPKKTEVVINKKNHYHYHQGKEILVMKGNKGENYLVPMLKSCKEPRRSLLFLDTPCIATS